ncbi:acetyl esterase/lipase [Geomicrobium halophilum]|uniref:Acetyl esterase/lipase n=1 Tax=Geomicrobium halophilum TaxID=549000 RepID=A0A841PQX5_9BACL|nr:alpha/beta hydrolase [Geomicrobium halophilum]MBB6451159.1 acetyl esterase/lipase [Geomicrobium halophilum]
MEKFFYGSNENQFGEWRLPKGDGPHPVAIVIHGGFWRKSFSLEIIREVARDLTACGFATWNIEYRRVGQPGGGWPGTFTDVSLACNHLRYLADSYSIDLDRVITVGHSAGGHLALWMAARHQLPEESELAVSGQSVSIAGAISLAGVNDLKLMYGVHHYRDQHSSETNNPTADLLQCSPEEQPGRYKEASPLELLPFEVPQLLVHGALDINVPIGISDHYHRAAQEAGEKVSFVELSDAEHFMLTDTSTKAWASIREEILGYVKRI